MSKKISFFVLFATFSVLAIAQPGFMIYNFRSIPQNSLFNPGVLPEAKVNVGLPGFSSTYFGFSNSGFRYIDAILYDGDSIRFDFESLLNSLNEENFTTLDLNEELIFFGFQPNDNTYLYFNVTEKASMRFRYPKSFFTFLIEGNAPFLDETFNFNFALDFSHFREYGAGMTRRLSDNFSVGGRIKYLYGMENMNTSSSDIFFHTDSTDFSLTLSSDIKIQTSGLDDSSLTQFGTMPYFTGRPNHGYGLDLGFDWRVNKRLDISFAALDMGKIHWKQNPRQIQNASKYSSYTFSGINMIDFIGDSTDAEDGFQILFDTLKKTYDLEVVDHESYKTGVYSKFYLGGRVRLGNGMTTGATIFGTMFNHQFRPALNLWHSSRTGESTELMLSYTLYSQSAKIFGAGWKVNVGAFEYYIITDNVLGLIFPTATKYINFRTGINFTFGRKIYDDSDVTKVEEIDYEEYDDVNDKDD